MKIPAHIDALALMRELTEFIEKEKEKYPNLVALFKFTFGSDKNEPKR